MNTANAAAIAAPVPPPVATWCADYAGFALFLAEAFLVLALAVAVVETALALWAKLVVLRQGPATARVAAKAAAVDPIKLVDALKGLLETLKGMPAWVTIFLAGLALLWMAGQTPEICAPELSTRSSTTRTTAAPARQTGPATNSQAPAETNAAR